MLYAVELKRTAYVTIYVDAENEEQAEENAWQELQSDGSYGCGNDADWELVALVKGPDNLKG